MNEPRGRFISLDGVDGAGKTTQGQRLCEWLRERGHEVVTCRDPGSTALGEKLRAIVLNDDQTPIHRRAEMLLYMAARAQLVEEVIRPALEQGKTVVSDRFMLANVVYQAYAGGLEVEHVWRVGEVAVGGVLPDLTIVLDISPAKAAERIRRDFDRMERQGADFFEKVRAGFLAEAARVPSRIVVVDAGRDAEAVQADLRAAVEKALAS